MDQPSYMNTIELLKSQSDLEYLKNGTNYYSSKVNVFDDAEYKEINSILESYLKQIKNGVGVKTEDIALLKKRWKRFTVVHAFTGLLKAGYVYPFIIAAVLFTPLFYFTTHTKPGYELIIIILITALLIYLVIRSKRCC